MVSRGFLDRSAAYLYMVIFVFVILMGIVIHDPLFFNQYTDYLALYSRSPDSVLLGYPYVDYGFEYTPIIASLWLIASKLALFLSNYGYDPYSSMLKAFYVINGVFYAAYVYLIYIISREMRTSMLSSILAIASPSIIYYLFYNWDIVSSFLMILGVYLFLKNKPYLSALSLGLGAAVKIMPISAMLSIFMIYIARGARKAIAYLLLGFSAAAMPFLVLLLIYPPGFFYFLSYHSQWYCENCFYTLLTDNIYDQVFRTASTCLMISIPIIFTIMMSRRDPPRYGGDMFIRVPLLSVALSISFSYIYSPQMNIFLAPLYILLSNRSKYLLLIQDILNTLIMILWFHEKTISSLLGIESRGPWFRESPVQWISFLRIVLIWILVLMNR